MNLIKHRVKRLVVLLGIAYVALVLPSIAATEQPVPNEVARQYTFAWQFLPEGAMAPRGGTTSGPEIELVTEPSAAWLTLQKPGLTAKQKDRQAILAMAGPYRASFDFIETTGFTPAYQPPAPYQSWGTEFVYVVEDSEDFISLQHILVMFIRGEDGELSDPIVVKHWRQDWRYEERDLYVYRGADTWGKKRLPAKRVKGTWAQSVFQVDDSPRYDAYGRWTHEANYSSWQSEETWRPLPRREFSVRDDYHVLVGTNRHTITPTGWVHVEDNKKVVLDSLEAGADYNVIAVEAGFNRYQRIANHNWQAGDEYWQQTAAFWAVVRSVWAQQFSDNGNITLKKSLDGKPLFAAMFGMANERRGKTLDEMATRAEVAAILEAYKKP